MKRLRSHRFTTAPGRAPSLSAPMAQLDGAPDSERGLTPPGAKADDPETGGARGSSRASRRVWTPSPSVHESLGTAGASRYIGVRPRLMHHAILVTLLAILGDVQLVWAIPPRAYVTSNSDSSLHVIE